MFTFRFHALPNPDAERDPAAEGAIGAYAVVWIDFRDQDGAEILARHYVTAAGWIPGELEEVRCPELDDYAADDVLRSYFNQACEYGYCVSFHLYSEDRE